MNTYHKDKLNSLKRKWRNCLTAGNRGIWTESDQRQYIALFNLWIAQPVTNDSNYKFYQAQNI